MSFQKPPGGTRGARMPPSNAVTRALNRVAMSWHRRSGDKFQGQDLLYLTTVGAKTGQKRHTTVARFPDGEDAWLVVASAGGSAHHPAWYHNLLANPTALVEVGDQKFTARATAFPSGPERDRLYAAQAAVMPGFAEYENATTRTIPVVVLDRVQEAQRAA